MGDTMVHEIGNKTLYELIFKQRNILLDIALILFSVAFLGVMANIQIPLWPVPITMQTFGVFLIAFFFGSRKGAITLVAYLLAGLVGFGVFAGRSSGTEVFVKVKEGIVSLGPSGGYIIGFIFAALVVGWLIEKGYGRTFKSVLGCMLVGEGVIYVFGLPWLWIALPHLTLWQLLMAGLIPFIVGDTLKALGAVALFPYLWKGAEKLANN
jgi:biotin transport system substrate-specific component|tara:strand:+ start:231 stop:860 length:630 start_codon:yes stop_codon:yes gene_type:complete